jgi:hypothetical protein
MAGKADEAGPPPVSDHVCLEGRGVSQTDSPVYRPLRICICVNECCLLQAEV